MSIECNQSTPWKGMNIQKSKMKILKFLKIIKLRGATITKSDAFALIYLHYFLSAALPRYHERFRFYIGPRQVFSKIVIRSTLNIWEQIEGKIDLS